MTDEAIRECQVEECTDKTCLGNPHPRFYGEEDLLACWREGHRAAAKYGKVLNRALEIALKTLIRPIYVSSDGSPWTWEKHQEFIIEQARQELAEERKENELGEK